MCPDKGKHWLYMTATFLFPFPVDPAVEIYSSNAPVRHGIEEQATYLTDFHCIVDFAAGTPHFTVQYAPGPKAIDVIHETTDVMPGAADLGFVHSAIMRLPEYSDVICTVTDNIGTYVATKTIISKG